ncbi:MAG: aldolase catalytic domain-containing protein [Lachnospiraceae bacterium]|nr:aldolase catalytic domain-containing protein [Lachnospiraceae bacterium]
MGERYLLDCTLRDGGYLNDWAFGHETMAYLFSRQAASGVDFIEVGFLDERRTFDPERTIQPDTACFDRLFGGFDRGKSRVVAMIDYGTCGIGQVAPAAESCLDGIRVIFKKHNRRPALEFCRQLKDLGYLVFTQAVSITSYTDEELGDLIRLVNDVKPFAVSMVDTYGLLDPAGVTRILEIIDRDLDPGIAIGYHAHNNFQLGYSNSVSVLNRCQGRAVLCDGSLYGMGKSAGNAPIELIALYMNSHFGKSYDVLQMQEAISTVVMDLYAEKPWGYQLFYYIAAANRCHPDYVSYLMNKRTLSVSAINEILALLPEEEKLNKNVKLLEKLYLDYQQSHCDDEEVLEELSRMLSGRKILLIGPGKTVKDRKEEILAFIRAESPEVLPVNHLPEGIPADLLFLTNSRRYSRLAPALSADRAPRIIATSNVTKTGGRFDYVLDYGALTDPSAEFPDNSLLMLLRLLIRLGIGEAYLAGFDGYTPYDINFYDGRMAYSFVREKAETLNRQVKAFLAAHEGELRVRFITPSRYPETEG